MAIQRSTQTKAPETIHENKAFSVSRSPQPLRAPIHPLVQLQQTLGNRAVNRLIQAKLKVGPPGDRYEQEADRTADTVMQMPGVSVQRQTDEEDVQTKSLASQITPLVQRQSEDDESAQRLQRQPEEDKDETAQPLQRQSEEDKDETAQPLQRQAEEDKDETAQPLQRQAEEDKDETAQPLQRQAEEDKDETAQPLQRQAEEDKDETAQPLQRQAEEDKDETAQPLQRQSEEDKDETAQPLQRQSEEDKDETAQSLQRQSEEDKDETAQPLQRQAEEDKDKMAQAKEMPGQTPTVSSPIETRIQSQRGHGESLPDDTRGFFESRFGYDFSDVQVHPNASEAGALNAQAFTVGQDVFVAPGRYEPDTSRGRHLLAHELTHTIQQQSSQGVSRRIMRRRGHSGASAPGTPLGGKVLWDPALTPLMHTHTIARRSANVLARRRADERTADEPGILPGVPAPAEARVSPEAAPAPSLAPQPETAAPAASAEPITAPETAAPGLQPEARTEAAPEGGGPTAEPMAAAPAAAPAAAAPVGAAAATAKAPAAPSKETAEAKAPEAAVEKAAPEGKAAPAEKAAEDGEAAAAPEAAAEAKAPASPEEDPEFQAVVKKAKGVARRQRRHAPAAAKAREAQAAAEEPSNAVESKAQANQVGEMEKAEAPPFDKVAFKEALKKRIERATPENLEEADNFKKNNKIEAVKGEMSGKVKAEKAASEKPLAEKTKQAPDKSGIEPKAVTKLPPAAPGKAPAKIGAEQAVPKAKSPSEVEAPLQQESASLDQQMAESDITEEQLAKSNEPAFQSALDSKKEAQTHAAEAPQDYRQAEQEQISQAKTEAVGSTQANLQGMHGDRAKLLTQVAGKQGQAKGKDEQARAKVAADLKQIYETTKTKVETILNELDGKVEAAFDKGAKLAQKEFEDYVDLRMRIYKAERYSGAGGTLKWGYDALAGMPDEVNVFYVKGRALYLEAMDRVLDGVVAIIGGELTRAKTEIAKGRQEIQTYVAKLPQDLQKVGQEAAGDIASQFDDLESSVDNKQDALIDTLAQKYQENLKAVDERINEMKEANKGLIDKAVGAIKGVIEAIRKIKAMFAKVFARISEVVGLILKNPIGFFKNLMKGLKDGFNNFVSNIGKHLQAGLIIWLTGALGPMNIQIPDDLFSLKGIFSLVMQILGLTWETIRKKAVKLFGEKVVTAMEKTVEIFQVIQREGPAGLWEYVKEQFSNLKEMVMDQIKEMVTVEIIKAGVKWVLSLLNPVAAFIKAAMAIYNIVMFFVERAAQIADFLNSVIDAVAAIAKGAVSGAAQLVETALAKSIPLIIGLLAALLGISGIAKKVQKIIQRIRKRIDKAINKVLLKAKKLFKKFTKAGKVAGKKAAKAGKAAVGKALNFFGIKNKFQTDDGKSHSLYYENRNGKPVLMTATTPKTIKEFLKFYAEHRPDKADKIETIRTSPTMKKIVRLTRELSKAKNKSKQDEIRKKLLEESVELSNLLRHLLAKDEEVGGIIDSYLLEGLTGTFKSMPKPKEDILTADHQPQAAILEWAAEQPYFGPGSNMYKRGFRRAVEGYAINLYHTRHVEGRTYGSKGGVTSKTFISTAEAKVNKVKKGHNAATREQEKMQKRSIVVDLIKDELEDDVNAMKRVIKGDSNFGDIKALKISPEEKEKLITKITDNIKQGEEQLLSQDLESLKN